VDTDYGLRGRGELLYLHWRSIANRRMQAALIVESFDEAKEIISRGLASLVAAAIIEVGLQAVLSALAPARVLLADGFVG
jgi:hypothetical protein